MNVDRLWVGSATAVVVLMGVLGSAVPAARASSDQWGSRANSWKPDEIIVESWDTVVQWIFGEQGTPADATSGEGAPTRSRNDIRYCPPTLFTFGDEREIITDCDGAGGTELTPIFTTEDGEEIAPEDIQMQPIVVTREDAQSLIVEPGNLTVQPAQPWVLVNTDTVVMTDAAEHVLGTEVLGVDVDVRVTPVVYTWDFGDGSVPVTGTDPGAPWPNHTVSHKYRTAGSVTISLRTEWDAAFRVEGTSGWVPVVGRAVTSQTADPLEVVTATPRLTTD